MKCLVPLTILLPLFGLLTGCASYEAQLDRSHSLVNVQHYFVVSNANDNRGLDQMIVASLKARGRTAEAGPLTMLPDETQAIVAYQDHWAWDFGDHLVFLQISVRDRKSGQTAATSTFSAKVPTSKQPKGIVDGLVGQFLPKKS